jgi:nicotinate-nucleotide pyrophosphorylase (carboxylating)
LLPLIYTEEHLQIPHNDGASLDSDVVFAKVRGSAQRLLAFERTALNFIQRTSGIATQARKFSEAVAGTGCTVLDTRKTMPGLRRIDKLAVKAGGCENHRVGLFDAILIKNNHITAAGGVAEALERCGASGLSVEIEVRTFDELDAALAAGAKRLLLDNFTPEQARQAVQRVAGRAKTEVSGNITLENVRAYAETGADYVSCGALTHSVRAMDISFRLEPLQAE